MPLRRALRNAAGAAVVLCAAIPLFASPVRGDGRDASAGEPGANVLDSYVFPSPGDPTRVVFALDIGPRSERGAPQPAFDPNVLYTLHVDNVGDSRDHLVFQFRATQPGPQQRIAAYGPAVPGPAGPSETLAQPLGATPLDATTILDKGVRFFAGIRRDPAFFDAARYAQIAARRAECFAAPDAAKDAFARSNVLALVVEAPKTLVAPRKLGRINVWWTAAIPDASAPGTFDPVASVGRAAVRDIVESSGERAASGRLAPYADTTLAAAVRAYALSPPTAGTRSAPIADALAKLFGTDELEADIEAPGDAGYLAIETATPTPQPAVTKKPIPPPYRPFGGRGLSSPAYTRTFDAFFGDLIPRALLAPEDGRETPCLTSDNVTPPPNPAASTFPYLDDPF
jgi:hypothetical protein